MTSISEIAFGCSASCQTGIGRIGSVKTIAARMAGFSTGFIAIAACIKFIVA